MVVYQVVQSQELPRFNPTKAIKDVVFTPRNARLFSRITRKYSGLIASSYFVGAALFPVVIFAPPRISQYVAIVEAVFEVPACVMALLALRADLVRLLVATYDYWFFVSTALIYTATFSLLLRDLRMVLIAFRWIGFQLPILIDANLSQAKSMVVAVIVNIALTLIAMVAVSLDAIPDMVGSEYSPGRTKRSLSARDLLANALFTMEILLMRIIIRNFRFSNAANSSAVSSAVDPLNSGPVPATTRCVTFRCWLKLHAVGSSTTRKLLGQQQQLDPAKNVQLYHTASSFEYDSTDILFPPLLKVFLHRRACMLFHGVGMLSAFLTVACAAIMIISSHVSPSPLLISISASAVASTSSYLGVLFLFTNRRLLSSVYFSFDFLFLTLQISCAHVCVCDMLLWRPFPTIVVGCMWIWIHWVLTLDALTPAMKERLHLTHSRQIAVVFLVMYLVGQVAILFMGIFRETWELQNGKIISTSLLGRHLEFRVLPFFASRMMTVTVWTVRLIWRFRSQDDPNKLIMLRGQVEYDYAPRARASVAVQLTSIVPIPAANPKSGDHDVVCCIDK